MKIAKKTHNCTVCDKNVAQRFIILGIWHMCASILFYSRELAHPVFTDWVVQQCVAIPAAAHSWAVGCCWVLLLMKRCHITAVNVV